MQKLKTSGDRRRAVVRHSTRAVTWFYKQKSSLVALEMSRFASLTKGLAVATKIGAMRGCCFVCYAGKCIERSHEINDLTWERAKFCTRGGNQYLGR